MPFANTVETVEFRYVNKSDPDGMQGLKPYSWNLLKDQDGNLVHDEEGNTVTVEPYGSNDSWWEFVAEMDGAMDDVIVRKASGKTNWHFDRKMARKMGRDYTPTMEQQSLMSGLMALITTASRGWHGPEFIVPSNMKDENGRPHPMRGRLAPASTYFISKRSPMELRAVELFLQNLYEPEGDEEVAYFRESGSGLGGPEESGVGAEGQGQPGGQVSLPQRVDGLEGGEGIRVDLRGDTERTDDVEAATARN